jgi:hypothetical protein
MVFEIYVTTQFKVFVNEVGGVYMIIHGESFLAMEKS